MITRARLTLCAVAALSACGDASPVTRPLLPVAPGRQVSAARTTVSDPAASWKFPLPGSGASVVSDGKYSDGTMSSYANGVCGVSGRIFATTAGSNSGDATLQIGTDRRCAAPRTLMLSYDDGVVETSGSGTFANLHDIENTTTRIAIGATVPGFLAIHYTPRCDALQFGKDANSDKVMVTRLDAHTWRATSQASPNDRAYCTTTGRAYHMQVNLIVISSQDLP